MLSPAAVRLQSYQQSKRIGCEISVTLPVLEANLQLRAFSEIQERALVLNAVVAASFGFRRTLALQWIVQNGAPQALSRREREFLSTGQGDISHFRQQVEALWAFAWALSLLSQLKFEEPCTNELRKLYPDLKQGESADRIRRTAKLRTYDEIYGKCDLSYCLHWCLKEAIIEGRQGALAFVPHVVVERRRALEWMLSDSDWDSVTLDT